MMPLERAGQYADKPVLTDAEAEILEREALQRNDADRRPPANPFT
jgi:hypothetical protein